MPRERLRPSTEVNSGSMADIAFLLLIFFLVTTTIANDRGIATLLPPKPDPHNPPPEVNKNDRNVFKIQANSLNKLLVEEEVLEDVSLLQRMVKDFVMNFGNPSEEAVEVYNSFPSSLKAYVNANGRKPDSSDDPSEAIVSFKADRGTSYELYIAVIDQLHKAYNEIYGARIGLSAEEFLKLDKKNPKQKALYEQARFGIPKAISIAEPTKIGK